MKSNKITLVINYNCMRIGGIETYFHDLMLYAVKNGHRVVWLTTKKDMDEADFQDIVNCSKIEKVFKGFGSKAFKKFTVKFSKNERIIMLSCEPLLFISAERLREEVNTRCFYHFLVLPHFTGNDYYPENYYKNTFFYKAAFRFMRVIAKKIIENNCVLGFSRRHLEVYEDNYKIEISNKEEKILPHIKKNGVSLSVEDLMLKANNRDKEFIIVTCARFEFPHKGYIIGLIKSFSELAEIHPQITLKIVGYGEGLEKINSTLDELSDNIRSRIKIIGKLLPEDLQKEYCKSTINIGLAGALVEGAKCALPSIVVRHYSYLCEAYGYYENNRDKNLSVEQGDDIKNYIEELICMSELQYVNHGIMAKKAASVNDSSVFNLFNFKNNDSSCLIKVKERICATLINLLKNKI